MSTEPYKPRIFISYAHADEPEKPAEGEVKWLSFVTGYLRPAIKHGAVDLWIDRLMPGGADWEREIGERLRACDIFILLVSRHSLSSDYVVDKEIAIIRERQAKGEEVHFYPLVLTPTPKAGLDVVRDKNLRPPDGKPLSSYREYERWEKMNEAADEIAAIAAEIAGRKTHVADGPPVVSADQSSAEPDGIVQDGKEIRIVLGTGAPFESEERVRVKLQSVSKVQVGNCKLDIVDLEPPSRDASGGDVSECALKTDISLGAGSELFVDVAYLDIGSPTALRGNYIHLAVARVGGFFAEAYAYSNLPLISHTFLLRLSRFSDVYDEIRCRLYLDANRVLRLEKNEGPNRPLFKSESSIAVSSQPDDQEQRPEIKDRASFDAWLKGQSREIAVAIAARAALRVLPLVARAARMPGGDAARRFVDLASAVLRATALAWVAGKYPTRAIEFRASADAASTAVREAIASADVEAARYAKVAMDAANAIANYAAAHSAATTAADYADYAANWQEIQADVAALQNLEAGALADLPLWSRGVPELADNAWFGLMAGLPLGEDWEVWYDWYQERVRGGTRGEAYELVFASVPLDVWEKSPAAANAWIREHLPPRADEGRQGPEAEIKDRESLETWLLGQRREVAVAIAARAALRPSPLGLRGKGRVLP